jgi:hypothetical protein
MQPLFPLTFQGRLSLSTEEVPPSARMASSFETLEHRQLARSSRAVLKCGEFSKGQIQMGS